MVVVNNSNNLLLSSYIVYVMEGNTLLHQIVRSDVYSDEEFTKVVNKLGKSWCEINSDTISCHRI